MTDLTLVSHHLCPYVQRAAIALAEKRVPFDRIYVDLSNKPDWFLRLSPLGKTPVLKIGKDAIFESAAILEYLEDTQPNPLHPQNPILRAEHRGWMEFGSVVLNDIAGFYSAGDQLSFEQKAAQLGERFRRIEQRLSDGPWFDGEAFSLVDTVFGPIFRYFDVFDAIGDFGILSGKPKIAAWRRALALRPSVANAAPADYPTRLKTFLARRGSHISRFVTHANEPA